MAERRYDQEQRQVGGRVVAASGPVAVPDAAPAQLFGVFAVVAVVGGRDDLAGRGQVGDELFVEARDVSFGVVGADYAVYRGVFAAWLEVGDEFGPGGSGVREEGEGLLEAGPLGGLAFYGIADVEERGLFAGGPGGGVGCHCSRQIGRGRKWWF